MKIKEICLALCFILGFSQTAFPQKVISGYIRDKDTGQPLPAANIQIEGTLKGTISNDQGAYILKLDDLPAAILVTYIGYASEKRFIDVNSGENQLIMLTPVIYQLEPIVVTDEDPAVRIMREVIRRKQEWRAGLKTFQAEAYTRLVLENDTSITSIMESISLAYWDKEKGIRELIQSRRQTSNIAENDNFASVGIITNLYDDDIEIAGFKLIGVTHPDALEHYDFRLVGQRQRDDKIVYDISVNPKSKLQPTFIGRVAVLDEEFALLEVDLKPGEAVMFPMPIKDFNLHYKQQFNNFGTAFWLPVDVRVTGSIKIGFIGLQFPSIIIKRISRLTDYHVNVPLPDSLYQEEESTMIDSSLITLKADSIFTANPEVVPFSEQEEYAYGKLDSTMTLEKAYQPSGPLARFVKVESGESEEKKDSNKLTSGLSPVIGFDRVDELTVGLKKSISLGLVNFGVYGGYKTGRKDWFYGGELKLSIGKPKQWQTLLQFSENSDTRYHSPLYPHLFTSIHTLLGYRDYFDYYRNRKWQLDLSYGFSQINTRISVGLNTETHHNLKKSTDFNILGRDITQRDNPPIQEGRMRSLEIKVNTDEEYIPMGIVGQNHWQFLAEFSSPNFLDSQFDFTRLEATIDIRIFTFLRRRLLPNTLDIHLTAGTSQGDLPPQRFGMMDGALQIFGPFGAIRSLIGKAYEGEKYLGVCWEHNFRTVPLEILGLRALARRNIGFILYGSSAKSWIRQETLQNLTFEPVFSETFHHEIGLAINGILDLFRLDFTQRLDKSQFYVGFSFSRFF
ncbi:MAG: carboxypeptidase-like regulatory domain-containing protein [bacterium]|nr:MAG: carboxypeptidase-like regulatory domain-containing protein [bacterium]